MIPKHANPFLLPDQTTVVSRAALRDSDDEEEPTDHADPARAQMLARLESILKRSIADVLPSDPLPAEEIDEDRRRKKKRRKVQEKEDEAGKDGVGQGELVAVPFRLLSGASQPKPIVLAPKPPPVYKSIGPSREDTQEEAERRAARVREVSVDFAWVMKESNQPYVPLPKASKKLRTITAKLPLPEPPLLLLERQKPSPKPPRVVLADPTIPVEPSPHAHETSPSCCPIVPAEPSSPSSDVTEAKKRKRRRGAARQKPAIQPAFWRPEEGMGGKSRGYAWGYTGSWPLREGETPRYRRDTMRKAIVA
ncbi:hypothetical protein BD414DRAFT_579026 [Trametes punicea]|nr:hypothetical protein BD414DRAFT_579026 [Trametes punicea]